MSNTEPDELRAAERAAWEGIAAGWETGGESFYRAAQPITEWLVAKLDPQPGQRLLELAAGRGDISLLLSGRVAPGGSVTCTDGAEAMVKAAQRRAEEAAVDDSLLSHKPMDLEWLDVEAASLDGILCRFGYMLCVDPEAAFHEARRVLKPGGRLVLSVWDQIDKNPWFQAMGEEPVKAGLVSPPDASRPGPFSLSAPGRLYDLLAGAGFVDPDIESLPICITEPSLDSAWDTAVSLSSSLQRLLTQISPADHYKLRDAIEARWAEHSTADGGVSLPGRVLCAVAEA